MPPESYELPWGDDLSLLVADVPWATLREILRELGVEVEVRAPVGDWRRWDGDWRSPGLPVLAGELAGRTYLYDRSLHAAVAPDLIAELAIRTGGLVAGHAYYDSVGMQTTTVARGPALLRFCCDTDASGEYAQGAPVPGETPEEPISSIEGLRRVLRAFGFVVEGPAGWLARGAKWDAQWLDPDPETQPEAHARLYFGPLQQRVAAFEEAALGERL